MQPVISVIVPCYNHGRYLADALNSVSNQDFTDWECNIIDDGSTDTTKEVAKVFVQKDQRFTYVYKPNGGLSSARNKGLDIAKGKWIQFLDADDMIHKDKFSASLINSGDADAVFSGFDFFTKNDGTWFAPTFKLKEDLFNFESVLRGWDSSFVFPPHSGLFKSDLFNQLRFDESLKAREDWIMWLQVFLSNIKIVFIDKPYALYRSLDNSMSKDKNLMTAQQVQAFKVAQKFMPDKYQQLFTEKVIDTLGVMLMESNSMLNKTRESKSYRLGNFFIRNFNKLNPKKSK